MTSLQLKLERQEHEDSSPTWQTPGGGVIMLTPALGATYWTYRVCITEGQAVLGFPKFGSIGIGFAVETDWNTNLPSTAPAEDILLHIGHNKGDESVSDADVLAAIKLIQAAVAEDRG